MRFAFALIHSPLVSPYTWAATAAALQQRGHAARVPDLADTPGAGPYWQQHTTSAAAALAGWETEAPLVLVAHSGAGALLPSVGRALARPVAAYLFVDAGWPSGGLSRLETFGAGDRPAFEAFLNDGGRFPTWQADDLAPILADAAVRARVAAELRPRGLDYWSEPLPVVAGWPAAPLGVLRYTATYAPDAAQAAAHGAVVRERPAGHFEMLAQPAVVAEELISLATETITRGPHG
jgi:hypothetical protein